MLKKGGDYVAKLTDRQRKQIIADYAGGGISQRELAERYQVTQKTISKILSTTEVRQKVSEKKEENTRSMLEYLDEQKGKAQGLIGRLLDASEEDIKKASLRDKMGAIKILSEVFSGNKDNELANDKRVSIKFVVEDVSGGDDGEQADNT